MPQTGAIEPQLDPDSRLVSQSSSGPPPPRRICFAIGIHTAIEVAYQLGDPLLELDGDSIEPTGLRASPQPRASAMLSRIRPAADPRGRHEQTTSVRRDHRVDR